MVYILRICLTDRDRSYSRCMVPMAATGRFPGSRFAALAEAEGIILANPLSHHLGDNEGEWQLNTPSDARHDIEFVEAIIDELSSAYAIDSARIYATGYSIGSMFTYELACHLSDRVAAIASFAGTMPVNPNSCEISRGFPVMHITAMMIRLLIYAGPWDWKAWDSVGTMHGIQAWSSIGQARMPVRPQSKMRSVRRDIPSTVTAPITYG